MTINIPASTLVMLLFSWEFVMSEFYYSANISYGVVIIDSRPYLTDETALYLISI